MLSVALMTMTALEMLLVNLFVIDQCSRRKYNGAVTYTTSLFFVCLFTCAGYLIASHTPGFGDGNGLFVITGFLFAIPVKLLYHVSAVKIVTVACSSWVYTFLIFAVSVRMGYTVEPHFFGITLNVFIIQTLLYILSFRFFYRLLQTKLIHVVEHIGKKESVALMWTCISWFGSLFAINLAFAYPHLSVLQLLALVTVGGSILSSYHYVYLQVESGRTIQRLEKIAYQDDLTQLRSRVVLGSDMADLIGREVPFHLIFIDLDDFKSINDRYGHTTGDRYLASFAHEIKVRLGNRGGFYRVAGDEFVCIFLGEDVDAFVSEITRLPDRVAGSEVAFLGLSYGLASFPEDSGTGEGLIQCADMRMYDMKHRKKAQPATDRGRLKQAD